jgi:phosphatidylethanolamine-binding protein (PEBP) family uncharacterized protein
LPSSIVSQDFYPTRPGHGRDKIESMALKLVVPAFAEGGLIPKLHSCEGADASPSLEWSGQPPETRSWR